jgi:hypothetical protein
MGSPPARLIIEDGFELLVSTSVAKIFSICLPTYTKPIFLAVFVVVFSMFWFWFYMRSNNNKK